MADDEQPTGYVAWWLNKRRHGFVHPRPVHMVNAQLTDNRPTMRREKPPETPPIVQPLKPWRRCSPLSLTGAPRSFALAAEKARPGTVVALDAGDAVEVRVKLEGGTLRAWWKAGRTTGAVYQGRKISLTEAKGLL